MIIRRSSAPTLGGRVVALLLVPCLVSDPASASAIEAYAHPPPSALSAPLAVDSAPFQEAALAQRLAMFLRPVVGHFLSARKWLSPTAAARPEKKSSEAGVLASIPLAVGMISVVGLALAGALHLVPEALPYDAGLWSATFHQWWTAFITAHRVSLAVAMGTISAAVPLMTGIEKEDADKSANAPTELDPGKRGLRLTPPWRRSAESIGQTGGIRLMTQDGRAVLVFGIPDVNPRTKYIAKTLTRDGTFESSAAGQIQLGIKKGEGKFFADGALVKAVLLLCPELYREQVSLAFANLFERQGVPSSFLPLQPGFYLPVRTLSYWIEPNSILALRVLVPTPRYTTPKHLQRIAQAMRYIFGKRLDSKLLKNLPSDWLGTVKTARKRLRAWKDTPQPSTKAKSAERRSA